MIGTDFLPTSVTPHPKRSCSNKILLSSAVIFIIGIFFIIISLISGSSTEKIEKLMASPDYNIRLQSIPGGQQYQIEIGNSGNFITYRTFLENLRDGDVSLIAVMTNIMRYHSPSQTYRAVFWECRPVSARIMNSSPLEFVLLDAPVLSTRENDISAFRDQFLQLPHESNDGVISFASLGKDATLVVPAPTEDGAKRPNYPQYMTHISAFHNGASDEHIYSLWKSIGSSFLEVLDNAADKNQKFWLSTSGLGVSWLHVRIDTRPKYYNYIEYKVA